jgi:hypothetical protein
VDGKAICLASTAKPGFRGCGIVVSGLPEVWSAHFPLACATRNSKKLKNLRVAY